MLSKMVGIMMGLIMIAILMYVCIMVSVGANVLLIDRAFTERRSEPVLNSTGNYQYFTSLCRSIQGYENQIYYLERDLEADDSTDDDTNRIRQSIVGVEAQRTRAIVEYNTSARMRYSAPEFKMSNLPYQLSIDRKTKCVLE